jgi:hypothetical protein
MLAALVREHFNAEIPEIARLTVRLKFSRKATVCLIIKSQENSLIFREKELK